ncbi:MAG: four helix bundle protein [Gemmataceae bacterium]|nr:four helix bundle protein [Gemmataceae bacterium]
MAIALGSAGKVRYQLYVALDQEYLTQNEFEERYTMAIETSRLISALTNYLDTKQK